MAHIHLEDGSFTLFWVALWWMIALVVIAAAIVWVRSVKKTDNRKITLAAFCTAAAFAIFQVSLPLFGGVHLNLTPLIGILAGPAFGSLIVLIINILSAAIGHGGWGLVGANLLVNVTEVLVAYGTWSVLKRVFSGAFARAGIATLLGLSCGNLAMIAIILVSGVQGVSQTSSQILAGLTLIAGVNMGAAVIEAFITGMIIAAIIKARPDLLEGKQP
ncbi:MAG TPA: energy-coupling factor ABC transporter permease [Methanoregula sp.]|nr:energy-coupling factor ABC transporter permease [Methanoregula sp.]